MACAFFLYGASFMFAPWWAAVVLCFVWACLLILATRWWTPHPRRLPWLAVGTILLWYAVILLGAAVFKWN